jgi:prepilin-type N-terminal cleavage/methylation domain-containing protein
MSHRIVPPIERRRRRPPAAVVRSPRAGMTLIEIIVAMMILVGVLFALGGFTAKYAQASGQAQLTIAANELAARRLDVIRVQPSYAAIDTIINTTKVQADFRWYDVKTAVTRIGGAVTDSVDYKLVTVTVTHPSMKKTITKTTAVAAF